MNFLKQLVAVVIMNSFVLAQISGPPVNLTGTTDGIGPVTGGGHNEYCTPGGTWIGSTTDGIANLPKKCMNTALANTPSPGVVHGPYTTFSALQSAVNAGACGDKYTVQAGTDLGLATLNLPAKNCPDTLWGTIESTGVSDPRFPAEGTRMTPCWSGVASMPNRLYSCPAPVNLTFKISAANASNAVSDQNGGDHWRIVGAEITRDKTGGKAIYNLVDLGSQNNTTNQANHIIFDRCWFDGVEFTGPATVQSNDTSTTRAVYLAQSNYVAVVDSYFTNFYDTTSMSANGNTDAQCISGGIGGVPNSGWGVYKFVNNHCEASGEGILFGGSVGPALTPTGCTITVNCNLDVPSNIETRMNYFFKPPQWSTSSGTGWPVLKNGFEMKIGALALFEGNVIENAPYGAQVGWCWTVAPKNQSDDRTGTLPTAPTALTNDFTYRYNYCYNAATGPGYYQTQDGNCPTCEAQGMNRVSDHDNLINDAQVIFACCAGDGWITTSIPDSSNRGLNKLQNVSIRHDTFVRSSRYSLSIGAGGPNLIYGLTWQDNIISNAQYGVGSNPSLTGCSTTNTLTQILSACVTGWTVDHNAVFGVTSLGSWPVGNIPVADAAHVGFVNYGTGDSGFNPGNYALTSSSPLHNAASDGRDIGADINTLLTKIAGVRL